jgi:uncharacterized membrane protein YeaQ/YmgE (transglycosylase-associated protein family)
MSYLISVGIGAIVGFVLGQSLRGTRHGSGIDALAGALGSCVAVLLSGRVSPTFAANWWMSAIVAVIGAVATLFVMRQFTTRKPAPAMRGRHGR